MRGIGAGQRIFDVLGRTPAIPHGQGMDVPPSAEGTIRFENVKFHYPTRKTVSILEGFDLEIRAGETVAIVGESGGGKSSIHSLLLRYYDPVHGKITLDGQGMWPPSLIYDTSLNASRHRHQGLLNNFVEEYYRFRPTGSSLVHRDNRVQHCVRQS